MPINVVIAIIFVLLAVESVLILKIKKDLIEARALISYLMLKDYSKENGKEKTNELVERALSKYGGKEE